MRTTTRFGRGGQAIDDGFVDDSIFEEPLPTAWVDLRGDDHDTVAVAVFEEIDPHGRFARAATRLVRPCASAGVRAGGVAM